jgi:carbamoyl-phosphate synthase large subunit
MAIRVAVSAVGGGIGQSIIKSLHGTGYETVGIDPKSDAAGLYMADHGYIGKNCDDKSYMDSVLEICRKSKCKFLFAGLDAELIPLSEQRWKFLREGIIAFVSSPEVIALSDDKWQLYQFLKNKGFPHIQTADSLSSAKAKNIPFPVIVKPMAGGCRSKNVRIFNTEKEVEAFLSSTPDKYIIQEYIEGDEYTCGSVTFGSRILGTIIMRRTLRDGDTYKAYVEPNKKINDFLHDLLRELKPFGPCNVQLRLNNNTPYILEINARCSGTTAARTLAGFNEPLLCCNYIRGKSTKYKIKNVAILRYWNECIVEYGSIKEIEHEGSIHRSKWALR